MLYIKTLEEGVELFKALGSDIRVNILCLLLKRKEMSMNEIAAALNITNGALTGHIKKLEDAGLLSVAGDPSGHGNHKICTVKETRILIDVATEAARGETGFYDVEIPVGQYTSYSALPTCGIATPDALIGVVDDPRYFAYPDRIRAGILWFARGFVEYLIPNLLPKDKRIDTLTLTMELSSEAPGVNSEWPSDITFSMNGVTLGSWTSPGDFGDVRGIFTPEWWLPYWNQYGLLKALVIGHDGTFLDGLKISDVTIDQFALNYKSTIRFRMEVREDAAHVGGMTVFGQGFGNYNQGIGVRVHYS